MSAVFLLKSHRPHFEYIILIHIQTVAFSSVLLIRDSFLLKIYSCSAVCDTPVISRCHKERNTRTEQFDMSKDRLTADKDVGKLDNDLRNKSLPHKDKDETWSKIGQPIG